VSILQTTVPPLEKDKRVEDQLLIGTNGQFSAALKINDKYYPITPTAFQDVRTTVNAMNHMPMLTMTCYDPLSRLTNELATSGDDYSIGDGAKIEIAMGVSPSDDMLMRKYRLISTPRIKSSNNAPLVTINAVLDNLKWWRGMPTGAYKGNSTEAIKNIALDCDAGVHLPHLTSDSMSWLSSHLTYSQLVNHITQHAWADDSSCMIGGMDEDRIYRFVDLSRIGQEKPTFKICWLTEAKDKFDISALDVKVVTGGSSNLLGVYGSRLTSEQQDGSALELDEVEVVKHGNFLDLNSESKKDVGVTRSRFMPPDAGNTHENYVRAKYQNERIGMTYKIHIDVYIEQVSGAGLFDVVELEMADTGSSGRQLNYSGIYFVTARVKGLNGGKYFEKLRLTTNSRNLNTTGKMT